MDRQKLSNEEYRKETFEKFYQALHRQTVDQKIITSNHVHVKKPKLNLEHEILRIFKQRQRHRNVVLCFVISLTIGIAICFFILLFWNAASLAHTRGAISIVDPATLQIIAVSFFVQLILVVRTITKALWDDRNYLNSPLLKRIHSLGKDRKS